MSTSVETLEAIRRKLLTGGRSGTPQHDHGVFWPGNVVPNGISTRDTVKRRLKAAGYAKPSPLRNGNWVLTAAGRKWLGIEL